MYKPHIALEVRILLEEKSRPWVKTFCSCGPDGLCPVCSGRFVPGSPGPVPRLNPQAARKGYLLTRGLGGSIVREAAYERCLNIPAIAEASGGKPPAAISRFSVKLGENAGVDIMFHRRKKRIKVEEIRIEEDAGRLVRPSRGAGSQGIYMDYSTAGMPSLRLRTAADLEIGEEAEVFLTDLRRRIQYLEILPGVIPENVIRCSAYVAIVPYPDSPDYFVKLKNLNSFNFVYKAVNAELSRQEEIITNGGTVVSENRIWNEAKNATESFQIRSREEKPRFERPGGLDPFVPGAEIMEAMENFTVEFPEYRRDRIMGEYGLTQLQAEFVCDEKSRADYFEKTASLGAPPREAAQWIASYCVKESRRLGLNLPDSPLTPERFSRILRMLMEKRIHSNIARQVISAVLAENRDPEALIRERGWEQLRDRKTIEGIVKTIIEKNPQEVRRIRERDAGPIQFLTGLIMKETSALAEPTLVKDVLKEQLSVSLVYVFSMGGAISGRIGEDGTVESGDEQTLRDLLAKGAAEPGADIDASKVRFESVQVGRLLSEEIVPADWAALIAAVAGKLNSGTANGIVVAHGTDTLSYTAPLLYWLFADAGAPIVLAASSTPPGQSAEAARTIQKAVNLALSKPGGVYVVHGGKILSPLNLRFEKIGFGADQFRNWNMERPVFEGTSLLADRLEADQYVLSQLLEDAVNSMCVIRIYPGLRSDYLTSLMDRGVKNFFLELYDTGTAGFREGPYSLKRVFSMGKRRSVRFYCSSQQEGIVDFSGYVTARELWRSGAVPMGAYTTETTVARFLAASIIADSDEERAAMMESAAHESTSG
ncbi:MAG: asparaginase domain-containing protein [Treponema sp.]|nr:asparaginase domain-containing protein [Treponema sp.]